MPENYFERKDFACGCGCGFQAVDFELLQILNETREHFGIPLNITSGCRCETHNKNEKGAANSAHKLGIAADFRPNKSHPDFQNMLNKIHKHLLERFPDKYGIAIGPTFVHLDVKPGNGRRWTY